MSLTFFNTFKDIVIAAFQDSFEIAELGSRGHFQPDFVLKKDGKSIFCEVKFYRSTLVAKDAIKATAAALAHFASDKQGYKAMIVSSFIPPILKDEIAKDYDVVVWDRSNLTNFLVAAGREDQIEKLSILIMEAQQGTDIRFPQFGIDKTTNRDPLSYFPQASIVEEPIVKNKPLAIGSRLIKELQAIKEGKAEWAAFEQKCVAILKHLFDKDLSAWKVQQRTDDELSRFDMICRINSQDDFWQALVSSFNSRFVLFEFKNYKDPIPQGQIYTTERYLFPKALRGTAIIIARNGAHKNAISAAKGALREHGKFILILDQSDLETMLRMKDNGDIPSDYLSDKLDDHLMSLSR